MGNGVPVSAGCLAGWLIHEQERVHAEAAAVTEAGLASSPWQHLDETATRVNGRNHHCFVRSAPLFPRDTTLVGQDRRAVRDPNRGRPGTSSQPS